MPTEQEIKDIKERSGEALAQRADILQKRMENIKHKIAVYSGKGGVGKTTVAVNLAVALASRGHKVGFLDADIDCPNSHVLFGINEKTKIENGMLVPLEKHGVKVISMSMLVDKEDTAIMWRGPMLTKAINDFLLLSDWGDPDYLIIDIPPGTSDAPITILQTLELDGFIIVTTPQAVAKIDATKSINMIKNLGKPIFGIVENMCGDVFGCSQDRGYLAHIPLEKSITESSDAGTPIVLEDEKTRDIFDKIIDKISG